MKRTKLQIVAISVIVFVVLLLAVLNYIVIPSVIHKQIESLKPGGLTITANRINTGLFRQSLSISGVQITDKEGKFNTQIEKIQLGGIQIGSYIFQKEVKVRRLLVKSPHIQINKDYKPEPTKKVEHKDTLRLKVLIKNIDIEKSSFALTNNASGSDSILYAKLDFHVKNFQLLPEQSVFSYKQFGLDELQFDLSDLHYLTNDGNYRMELNRLRFSTETSDLNADGFHLVPLIDKYEIGNKAGKQMDWFDINLKHLKLEKIDLEKLLLKQEIWLTKLKLDSIQMQAFRDVRLPMGTKPDTKLPGELIAHIPLPMYCDTFLLSHANIRYLEHAKDANEAGHVDFTGLHAASSNFTNIDSILTKPVIMDIKAKLFDQAMMSAQLTFASKKFPNAYRMTGQLAPMQFTAFNSMIEPALSAKIESGQIHRMSFDFTYNNDVSHGKLLLDYDNVKIEIMKRENHKDRKLESWLINAVVHQHNLPDNKHYREGKIEFERDKKKSFFNFWWKSILSGIKSVMV